METKTHFESIGYYENVLVICKDYSYDPVKIGVFTMDNDFEHGNALKFGDVLSEAKNQGFNKGVILLILESYLDGKIYRYGNYNDGKWYLVGTMEGFA